MTVKELIRELKKCNPNAKVDLEIQNSYCSDEFATSIKYIDKTLQPEYITIVGKGGN